MRAILTFHGVDESGSVLSVTPGQLASLLDTITECGHAIVPLVDLLADERPNRVALTFDDGFASVHDAAAAVLERRGLTATLFVATDHLGGDNRWPGQPADAPVFPTMDWGALEALHARGFAVESHSAGHPYLTRLDDDALAHELSSPKQVLKERLGVESDVFAYPYGVFDARVASHAARHYRYGVTTNFGVLSRGGDPLRLPRLDAYYLRSPRVHRFFGRRRFSAYLGLRGALRRVKRHSGEVRA